MSKYQELKGLAYNMAQKFAASANHFAFMALQGARDTVHIDLLLGTIVEEEYRKERNQALVNLCVDNLRRLINEYGFKVKRADLEAVFDIRKKLSQGEILMVPTEVKVHRYNYHFLHLDIM